MRLSKLRPCDGCGGPLFRPPHHWFHVVRISGARVDPGKAALVARLAATGGVSLERAEDSLPADLADSVEILSETAASLEQELHLCSKCIAPIAAISTRKALMETGEVKAS